MCQSNFNYVQLDIQSPLHRRFYVWFSGVVLGSDKCSGVYDYLDASTESDDNEFAVGLFKSMKKDQDCLAKHFMAYEEIVGKLGEEWKGE